MNQPLVSIVVVTFNGERYIKSCLNSVFGQSYPHLEILVIDNASTDGTLAHLKALPPRENFKTIFNSKNTGFASGHNRGIAISKGEFILCLNQDVVLGDSFVANAVKAFQADEKVGAVQGKLLRWNVGAKLRDPTPAKLRNSYVTRIIDTTGLMIFKNRRIINCRQGEIDYEGAEQMGEIFGADGAAPAYRRRALEDTAISIQGRKEYFDEDFFLYKEDVDLAWRLRLNGWKAVYQPAAIGWHDRTAGESTAIHYVDFIRERRKISKSAKYFAFKNQRLMQIKNEQAGLLLRHLPWFLPKEILSWFYVLLFERYTWKAMRALFRQAPRAWHKRQMIKARLRVDRTAMSKWFQ